MKLSIVIPYYESHPEKKEMLQQCVDSFKGQYDELVLVWNDKMGFSKAVNKGFELATGDYIAMVSDDCFLVRGTLRDLMVQSTVTSPLIKELGHPQDFSGILWCFPKAIYKKYGMLDEKYTEGIYYEDEDLWMKLKAENIPHRCVETVEVSHPYGGATLQQDPERERRKQINKDYFNSKWKK